MKLTLSCWDGFNQDHHRERSDPLAEVEKEAHALIKRGMLKVEIRDGDGIVLRAWTRDARGKPSRLTLPPRAAKPAGGTGNVHLKSEITD